MADRTPLIRVTAMPSDTNPYGGVFGGWLMGQMGLACGSFASRYTGGKALEIEHQLGLTAVAYYRELNEIIDLPAALEHDPTLVRRLQRARALRRRRRSTATLRLAHG